MPVLARRRSYAEAVEGRRRLGRRVLFFLLFFLCFEILSGLFLAAYRAGSATMAPTILPGELLLATPLAYGPRTIFGKIPWSSLPERGDIVLADPPYAREKGFGSIIADSFVRFVTFQRISSYGKADDPTRAGAMIMRIIALPGDTLAMEDSVYKVKPAESSHFLTEFELSSERYDISRSPLPEGWKDSLPASGSMEERILGPDEYFLDGDSRSAASGSRLWGPVSKDRLLGKVVLRYWPFKRFGAP
jgi:signal peptidase I